MQERRSSDRNVVLLAKMVLIGMAVQLIVIGYVFWNSYEGRIDTVTNQRAGCERGKLDRAALSVLNRSVLEALMDTDRKIAGPVSKERTEAEQALADSIPGLTERLNINCEEAFPKASLTPR